MQELLSMPISRDSDEEDQEALQLFNNIGLQVQDNLEEAVPPELDNHEEDQQSIVPVRNRLHKMKRESKKEKKKRKIRQKLNQKNGSKLRKSMQSPKPKKKLKREGSTKRKSDDNQEARMNKDDRGSSQFDSFSENKSDMQDELRNLNPDLAESNSNPSPQKRLKKSGRKQKIQQRQGFKLSELGNDGDIKYSDDESYSLDRKKKKRSKKERIKVPTNEEIMQDFKNREGIVESQGEEEANRDYDRGIDMLNTIKSKSKNSIRINNRLFGDLEMNLQNEGEQMPIPENLQLELLPKNSMTSSMQRGSFLLKAESIKKQRGLEADINLEEYQRNAQEKAKKSMAKVVSSMVSQDFHDDLDVDVRIPTVMRGKSSDIINNTTFLRKITGKKESEDSQQNFSAVPLKQTKSVTVGISQVKKEQTRQELYRQIQMQSRMRRSKYLSYEEIKNSFKKTDLKELQDIRKKNLQKKRKQALSDDENSNESKLDSEMKEMIEKQELICGDIEGQEEQDEVSEQKIIEEDLAEGKEENQQAELDKVEENEDNPNEELEQYRQLIEEQASQSEHQQAEEQPQQESDFIQDLVNEKQKIDVKDASDKESQKQLEENIEEDSEKDKQRRELEEEGIIVRRRNKKQKFDIKDVDMNQYLIGQEEKPEQQIDGQDHEEKEVLQEVERIKNDSNQEFKSFKKLRKIAQVIARKKKQRQEGRQYASQFIQNQAEQGSDNQDHDDIVKNINYEQENKEYQGIDLDADLVELIDNAVDLNEDDQFEAFRKYLEDVRIKDREEIKKIIKGQFWKKHEDLQMEMQEDEKNRLQRMENAIKWIQERQEKEGEGMYQKSPEHSEHDSDDDDSSYRRFKAKKKEEEEEGQSQEQAPEEQQMAKLDKFLEQTLPAAKKQYKPVLNDISLLPMPESVKMERRQSVQSTISMSKFGNKTFAEINPLQMISRRNTSSLVNQMLNKKGQKKILPQNIFKKGKK